jgi:DNA-binding GntR family transcriptional regulator
MDKQIWIGQPLDRHSPIPLYQQLSDTIATKIRQGELKPGIQLPSENELINLFGVSRFVVRQTLNSMFRQGLIYTEQGKGSFVTFPKIMKPLDILQSYQVGMKKAGINVDVQIISKSFVTPSPFIAEKLTLQPDAKVMKLERIAYQNDLPVNLLVSHLTIGNWGEEKLASFQGGSLYEHLSTVCDISLNRSVSEIEVIFADEYESRMLNQARGTVLLQISGVSYEISGMPVEHSRVVYPGSMFGFRFESYISNDSDNSTPELLRPL